MTTYIVYYMNRSKTVGFVVIDDVPIGDVQATSLVEAMSHAKKKFPQHGRDLAVRRM